ncbi:hypothetical protein [Streptomyces sp. NRRL B-24484]|uniref:hypothetical protein n=1 Tax=Streptomyces sp. NRRL B-24484 TaxID=1463833 RepID=UPI0004C0F001|nr:hypothetical protein [Streptomyces sp. NRRL B-24484]
MIGKLLGTVLGLVAAGVAAQRRTAARRPEPTPRIRTMHHWRCECGGHSRGGFITRDEAWWAGERHRRLKEAGHPTAELYTSNHPDD